MVAFEERSAVCPICGGAEFDIVGETVAGGWSKGSDGRLDRTDTRIPIGRCLTCDHTQVAVVYRPEFLSSLYTSDRIQGDDLPCNAGANTIRFCLPELLDPTGTIVDLGCGRGELLANLRSLYGIDRDRLLGIDFLNRLSADVPFREADLNRLAPEDWDYLKDSVGFAFATHVLEHLVDPRAFLRTAARVVREGGFLYLEVPDFAAFDPRSVHELPLVNPQHIHYFTDRTLRIVVESCGFRVVRWEGGQNLRLLAQRRHEPAAARVVQATCRALEERRRGIAETIAARAALAEPVAVWGLGLDFATMISICDPFRSRVEAGIIALFDLLHAGCTVSGQRVRHPDEIGAFDGSVYLLPSLHLVSDRMRAHAAAQTAWPSGRVIDPWRGSVGLP